MFLNSAGVSAADPVLKGLGVDLVFGASSMDVATVNDAFIDAVTGFPGTNSVKASLSPAATVLASGSAGTFNDTTKNYGISSTTGLTAGDYIYLSHASITDGEYKIASIVDGTNITVVGVPGDGGGNLTGIAYQIAWKYGTNTATAPITSSVAGAQNFVKFDAQDSLLNKTQLESNFYVRDAPAGAAYIELEGGNYTGQTAIDFLLTLVILTGWVNNGGVSHISLANHSVQAVNNFAWQTGGGTGEKTLADAEGGLTADAGNGAKYGRLLLKSAAGAATTIGIDIDITVDTTGPVLTLNLYGA